MNRSRNKPSRGKKTSVSGYTRRWLTDRGYLVGSVERRREFPDKKKKPCNFCEHQPMISISVDLFNCFDFIAEHPQLKRRIYVQVTSHQHHAERRNKILASMEAKILLLAGASILIQSWQKDDTINRWVSREEWITLEHFKQAPNYPETVRELLEIQRKEKAPSFPTGSELFIPPQEADDNW